MSMSSTFAKALDSWGIVQLPTVQRNLDVSVEEVTAAQESTLESRKHLAARTKEFRKLSDDEKLGAFKSLLKLYQSEVDALTNRAKKSENALFECYRAIGEVPDPKPLLEASLDSVLVASEVEELKRENEKLKEESLKYSDYEQLQSKVVRLGQQNAEQLANKLKLKEEEMNSVFAEKELQWQEKANAMQQSITSLQKEVVELKAQSKVDKLKLRNQRIALGGAAAAGEDGADDEGNYDENDVDASVLVSADAKELEALKHETVIKDKRILNLEKRNEDLTKKLSVAKSEVEQQERKMAMELKLADFERENATLVARVDHKQHQYDSLTKTSGQKIQSLQSQIGKLQDEFKALNQKMGSMSDYDQLKREVITLRAIQFGEDEDDDDEDVDEADPVKSTHQLDEILAARNKKLTAEVADFRSRYDSLNDTIAQLKSQVDVQSKEMERLKSLNSQLEDDLLSLQSSNGSKYNDTASMISGVTRNTSMTHTHKSSGRRTLSPASSIAGGIIYEEEGQQQQQQSSSSVLPIITAQRDRFRSRNAELETQLKKQTEVVNDLRSKISKLQKDNTDLFEKTRYLSSFKGSVNRGEDVESQQASNYSSNYEEQLHPLARFRAREEQRALSRLSPLERIFISFAKAVLANKTSRMCFFGYISGLHCLVALMMWYLMGLHGVNVARVGHETTTTTTMGGSSIH